MNQNLTLYICYAQSDEKIKNEFENHLSVLKKKRILRSWDSKKVARGEKIIEPVYDGLKQADIILLLISAEFLRRKDNWKSELDLAMERSMSGLAQVVPIILENCEWQNTPISSLQVLPKDGKPISNFKNKNVVYSELVREIEQLIAKIEKRPKWLRIIEEELTKRTGKLDLKESGLVTIPNQVSEMFWLEELFLSLNQIAKIEGLENLTGVIDLDLSGNQITKIEGLQTLTKLNTLDLSGNQIAKIEGLENLTGVIDLDLSGNQITKIEGLQTLTKLNTLDLSRNQIAKIEGLENLALTKLFFLSNQIEKIEGLDKLTGLNTLTLSGNRIKKIEGLDKLNKLSTLDLSFNQISKIEALDKLPLTKCYLHINQITKLEGLDKLIRLNTLDLSDNRITTIEGLEALPKSIKRLVLYGNPIENIDITVFGASPNYNCVNDLKNFFAERVDITVPEVNLILTGNSDVGKTKFRTFLSTGKYDTTRNSTHGLEVHPYTLEKKIKQRYGFEEDTRITIWDFGGQEYFHNTHQLFFNQNAVYIFLWEKGTNKNEPIQTEVKKDSQGNSTNRVLEHFDADYWLSNIRHFAKDATIILVQNKIDNYKLMDEPLESLSHACVKNYGCTNQYHISIAKSAEKDLAYWYDFEKLKHIVFSELKTSVSKNKEGNIYNQVRKQIEQLKSKNYWKVEDFISFIENLKKASSSVDAKKINNGKVIEHFSRQGKVLYPVDTAAKSDTINLKKGEVIFTNPQWLSERIYEILNDSVLQRNGFFDEKDLEKFAKDEKFKSAQIVIQVVDLMKQYNIVFYNPNRKQYVVPQYLPEVPTVHYSQVKKLLGIPTFVIQVDGFLPKSIITNIIARYAIKDDAANFYKYGVKTEEKNKDILLIEVDYTQKKIYVYTDATEAIYARDVFREILLDFDITLNDINVSLNEISDTYDPQEPQKVKGREGSVDTQITTSKYKLFISIDDKIFVDWITLWNNERSAEKSNDYCLAKDGNMVLRRMFAPYYLRYEAVRNIVPSNQAKPNKVFISYSSKNTDFMKRLVTHLEPLKRNGTIELWYDRMIEPGTKWDDSIKEEMKTADVIIFLLSPDFIATNYIFEFEIPQAIKQMESENSKLFFVELQSCSWHRTVLSRFQQTTDPTANNKGVIVIGEAMNDAQWKLVIDELEKKISKK